MFNVAKMKNIVLTTFSTNSASGGGEDLLQRNRARKSEWVGEVSKAYLVLLFPGSSSSRVLDLSSFDSLMNSSYSSFSLSEVIDSPEGAEALEAWLEEALVATVGGAEDGVLPMTHSCFNS